MSYASHEGVLRSTTAPLTATGANQIATMAQVFGVTNINYVHNPDEENPAEVMSLQRALEGKNAFAGQSLLAMMTSANPVLLQLFPVKRTNTLTHEYHYIDFPKEFAVETSPGSAPGYGTFAKSKRTATLSMYQFGARTTFQELRHSEGVTIWYGKLITMAICFIEAAEALVIQCLLDTPSFYAEYFVKTGKHEIDLARAGRLHDLFFDVLHRRDNGMAELVDAVRSDMVNSRSIEPTHMLISEGIATLSITSLHTEYYRNGPGASTNAVKLTDAFPDVYDGIRVIKVRPLDYREKRLHINLLERNVQIGQNFALDFFHAGADLANWTTNWLTIGIYSMETDDWAYIGIKEAIDHSGRFSRADGHLSSHHYALAKDARGMCKRASVPLADNRVDMFLYAVTAPHSQEIKFEVARVFGQMEKWALSDEAVERTSTTIAHYLRRTVGDEALADIDTGLENITELYEREPTAASVDRLIRARDAPLGKYGVPSLTGNAAWLNGLKPTEPLLGYGTVAGYFEIAQADPNLVSVTLITQAQKFVKAAKRFYRALEALFPCDHIALDPKYMPAGYRSANQSNEFAAIMTLFQNIVDSNKLTLSKIEAGAGAGARVDLDVGVLQRFVPDAAAQVAFQDAIQSSARAVYERFAAPGVAGAAGAAALGGIDAFVTKFNSSALAAAYSAGQQSARRGRATRGAASVDVDGAAGAASVSFGDFVKAEFTGTSVQNARLLSRVIELVDNPGRMPVSIDASTLNAWRGSAAALEGTTANQRGVPTGLAVPLSVVTGNPALTFASPYGDGSVVTAENAKALGDGSGVNVNILRTAFHMQSKARSAPPGTSQAPFSVAALPPLFAQTQFTDIVAGEVVINQNMQMRYDAAGRSANWLMRVAQKMLIFAPICLPVLHAMCKNNVMPPVAILLEQPWRRYTTSTVIFISKPSTTDLGNVLVLDPDMTSGYNAISKEYMVNTTMYLGALAFDCQNWYVAHDVAVVGYNGGETAKLFDLARQSLIDELNMLPRDGPSILPFMVPAGSIGDKSSVCKVPPSHNMRGYRSMAYYQANSKDRNLEFANKPMHPSAPFYTSYLNLNKLTATPEDWKFHQSRSTYNTETHRGLSLIFDPVRGCHDRVIMPQDQFKTAVYPGCRENRMSTLAAHYKDMQYETRSVGGF
mgnify:CR=1 FL=1